ncbi:FAD-binding protein [Streptomyces sp. DT2A-34]|uniref:FAD-binding protein n=1 Tax=Streptomyces sp. DT2A-34 TaxID=3051182 RepID=UPI00265BC19D|nr:FAD-binding protein [Streptomyces sp. DT2A-34]MDO0910407.1 FAD-binding protein [Streptomyces sp. DT2A-34]
MPSPAYAEPSRSPATRPAASPAPTVVGDFDGVASRAGRSAGPLIAVRLNILTRKTLGGLQTDLSGRVLDASGTPISGLYAAGEVAGFGGGGVHGCRSGP